jgi:hypothetical protein
MLLTSAGMRRHVHAGNHAAESFVSFIPLFDGPPAIWRRRRTTAQETALECTTVSERRQPRPSDFLLFEAALALWFWVPYAADRWLNVVWERWPWLGLVWFGSWIASPVLTLVGLLMVPRALRVPGGWVQVVVGILLASSLWYQLTRMEF